jgi:hypothetical protein
MNKLDPIAIAKETLRLIHQNFAICLTEGVYDGAELPNYKEIVLTTDFKVFINLN